jgi:hypothetical protein
MNRPLHSNYQWFVSCCYSYYCYCNWSCNCNCCCLWLHLTQYYCSVTVLTLQYYCVCSFINYTLVKHRCTACWYNVCYLWASVAAECMGVLLDMRYKIDVSCTWVLHCKPVFKQLCHSCMGPWGSATVRHCYMVTAWMQCIRCSCLKQSQRWHYYMRSFASRYFWS